METHSHPQFMPRILTRKMSTECQDFLIQTTYELKKAISLHRSDGGEEFHPEMIVGLSEILDFDDVANIKNQLPKRLGQWYIKYTASIDGRDLEKMYTKMQEVEGPVLIVIKDMNKHIFGAFCSNIPQESFDYYGTDETFLFKCFPKFECYKPPHTSNGSFLKGRLESFYVGGGNSSEECGLQINRTISKGKSDKCLTFENMPLVAEKIFEIKSLECWSFSLNDDEINEELV